MYGSKIPFHTAPEDDRDLPDLNLALYNDVVVFDQATKIIYVISWVHLDPATTTTPASTTGHTAAAAAGGDRANSGAQASSSSSSSSNGGVGGSDGGDHVDGVSAAHAKGFKRMKHLVQLLTEATPSLPPGTINLQLAQRPASPGRSNMTKDSFLKAIAAAKEYILVREGMDE